MSQKAKVLSMLKASGGLGVRSDAYLAEFIPRAAARIKELREEGYEITSEREKQFVRYRLANVGHRAEGRGQAEPTSQPADATPCSVSSARSVPSMFDADIDWEAAA